MDWQVVPAIKTVLRSASGTGARCYRYSPATAIIRSKKRAVATERLGLVLSGVTATRAKSTGRSAAGRPVNYGPEKRPRGRAAYGRPSASIATADACVDGRPFADDPCQGRLSNAVWRNPRAHLFTGTLSALGFEKLVGRQGLQGILGSIGDDFQATAVAGDFQVTERHRHVFVAHSQETANAEHNLIHRSIGL